MKSPTGVLVMSYGTPANPEQIETYYTHVRRGRPPSPEQVADLRRRYEAIGGVSPLAQRTKEQAAGLARALGEGYQVFLGAKHSPPFIEDGVRAMAEAGVERAVALVLAPHYSALSVGEYLERVRQATPPGMTLAGVESWHLEDGLIKLLAERVASALAEVGGEAEVLITAHSLPRRVLDMGDPYPMQLRETAEAVCSRAGVASWRLAWQSAGRTPEPWLGPDILEVISQVASEGGKAVVVCPAGFASDHLEVLYDVDIEARQVAAEAGLALARTRSLNDDPRFLAALAEVVRRTAGGLGE
jgi:ferrochelatase